MLDLVAVRQNFEQRGYSFDIFVDPPGQKWMGFVHAVDEIVVPIEGRVTLYVAGERFDPAIGEEVFIPAHALHDVITSYDGGSRWAYGYKGR
jgi:mannose-6-phosphate isomerase-like protein (cupin superfamily)